MKSSCQLQVRVSRLKELRSLFLVFFSLALAYNARAEPSAEALLREARLRPTAHPITLNAEIRGGEEPLPLIFKIEQGHIEYLLHNPEEKIILTLGKNQTSLTDTQQGKTSSLFDEQRYQNIRNTGVTYDDLSLGFLYWPHPRLARSEQFRGTKAFVLELLPPQNNGPYGSARLWIDQNSGAPLRIESFDKSGNLLKRFEVISAQKINDLWMLKEMRIETFDPQTHAVTQRRYLTIHHS